MGERYHLLAELHLRYEDGSETVVGTDESWKVRRSKILFSGIFDGEIQDDTTGGASAGTGESSGRRKNCRRWWIT